MKKFITILIAVFAVISASAQSFQYHQGYDFKSKTSSQKFIADFFWSNDSWNVFSWNNVGVNYNGTDPGATDATALLYVEYKLGKSDFYLHPEVRFNTWCENYYQFGFAYRIPFKNLSIYLTPKYSYHGRHDFQFSINSSYESEKFYHEGYLDSDWVYRQPMSGENVISFFTEQKFYYKVTRNFHLGVNLMLGADTVAGVYLIAPMAVARISLY